MTFDEMYKLIDDACSENPTLTAFLPGDRVVVEMPRTVCAMMFTCPLWAGIAIVAVGATCALIAFGIRRLISRMAK